MAPASPHPVVHLELHTRDLPRACGLYSRLFGWRVETIEAACGRYQALDMDGMEGGVVECPTGRALWLPYVQVEDVAETTQRARELGASVPLEPREGPAGWRGVLASTAGAEVGLWQPKSSRQTIWT
jgi:predicted enzyme related to lactoylglutathione lyase